MPRPSLDRVVIAALWFAFIGAQPARGQDYFWSVDSNGSWYTASNWNTSSVPSSSAYVNFSNTMGGGFEFTTPHTVTFGGQNTTIFQLYVERYQGSSVAPSSGASYTFDLGGAALTVSNGIYVGLSYVYVTGQGGPYPEVGYVSSKGSLTLVSGSVQTGYFNISENNLGYANSASGTLTVGRSDGTGAATMTVSGQIRNGSVYGNGSGRSATPAAVTVNPNSAITSGSVLFDYGTSTSGESGGTYARPSTSTIDLFGSWTNAVAFTFRGTSLNVGSGATLTTDTLEIGTANGYGSGLTLGGGGRIRARLLDIQGAATIYLPNFGPSYNSTFEISGTTSIDVGISASGGRLAKDGAGTLTLQGSSPNQNTGLTTVIAGTLAFNKPAGVNAIGGDLYVTGGTAKWMAANQIPTSANVTLASGTIDLGGFQAIIASLTQRGGSVINTPNTSSFVLTGTSFYPLTLKNATAVYDIQISSTNTAAVYAEANGAGNSTLDGAIDLGGATRFITAERGTGPADLYILRGISNGGVTLNGPGIVQFAGTSASANTYAGGTTITAGTLVLNKTANTNAVGTGPVTINGGTLQFATAGQVPTSANVTLTSGTIDLGGNQVTLGYLTQRGGSVINTPNTSSFVLTGTSFYPLTLKNATAVYDIQINSTNTAAVYAEANGAGNSILNGMIDLGGATRFITAERGTGVTDLYILRGIVNGGVNINGPGIVEFGGGPTQGNTYTGLTTISGGTLSLSKADNTNALSGDVAVTGGTLRLRGNEQIPNNVTTVSSGTFDLNGYSESLSTLTATGGTITVPANSQLTVTTLSLSGTATLAVANGYVAAGSFIFPSGTISGYGIVRVPLATYGGTFAINNPTGAVNTSMALNIGGGFAEVYSNAVAQFSGAITLGGGRLDTDTGTSVRGVALTGTGSITGFGTVYAGFGSNIGALTGTSGTALNPSGGTLTIYQTGDSTFSGTVGGTGTLNKDGAGSLTLGGTAANTNTGPTTVAAGTLVLAKPVGVNAVGGDVAVAGGTLRLAQTGQVPDTAAVTITAGTFDLNGIAEQVGSLSGTGGSLTLGAGSLTVNQAADLAFNGTITGAGTFTKAGTAVLTLGGTAANTFTGATTVTGGALVLGKPAGTAAVGGDLAVNGGTAKFAAANQLTAGATVTVNGGSLDLNTTAQAVGLLRVYGGNVLNPAAAGVTITRTDAAGVILRNVTVGANLAFTGPASTAVQFDAANNGTGTLGGTLDLGAAVRTVAVADGSAAIDLAFIGIVTNGWLTKTGAGTLALSGNNTYTGGTAISGGTLAVNGQAAPNSGTGTGAVAVTGGGLSGTGRVAGAVTVTGGGVTPGTGTAGRLTVGGSVSFAAGTVLSIGVGATGTSTGLTLDGAAAVLNFATGSKLVLTNAGGFAHAPAAYTVATLPDGNNVQVNGTGNLTGGAAVLGTYVQGVGASGPVTIDPSALAGSLAAGDTFTLARSGNAVALTFTAVPEPAAVFGLPAAVLVSAGLIRRRVRRAACATPTGLEP